MIEIVLYIMYVTALVSIGAGILTVELIDWIKKGSPLPILPLCYWEWFIMYSPALLTIVQ